MSMHIYIYIYTYTHHNIKIRIHTSIYAHVDIYQQKIKTKTELHTKKLHNYHLKYIKQNTHSTNNHMDMYTLMHTHIYIDTYSDANAQSDTCT